MDKPPGTRVWQGKGRFAVSGSQDFKFPSKLPQPRRFSALSLHQGVHVSFQCVHRKSSQVDVARKWGVPKLPGRSFHSPFHFLSGCAASHWARGEGRAVCSHLSHISASQQSLAGPCHSGIGCQEAPSFPLHQAQRGQETSLELPS